MTRATALLGAPAALLLSAGLAVPAAAQSPCGASYTVRAGDTLYRIAQRCGTSVSALVDANDLITNPNRIGVGWTLAIPGGSGVGAEPAPAAGDGGSGERTYRVQPGDTLYGVASRLGVSLAALLAENAGIDPHRLGIGDIIRLPGGAAPPEQPGGDLQASVSPQSAAPGETVTVEGRGFRADERVRVAAGPPRSEYQTVSTTRADAQGRVRAQVKVPEWADPGRGLVWALVTDDRREAFARGFRVEERGNGGSDDSVMEVTGTLTREGVECPALRSDGGRLYTLAGDTGRFGPGDRVRVRGSRAEMSICQQGTTIDVRSIEAAG